jgi:glycosyltransferase involved in cell wall biosynthesis
VKIAVVTSQFPVSGEPTRGRPLLQTIEALSRLAELEVFVPNARYPRRLAPRSYSYVPTATTTTQLNGLTVHQLGFPTLPYIGRLTNGYAAARALHGPLQRFAPSLILAYWLYPDVFGAARVGRSLGIPCIAGARGSDLRARDRVSLWLTRQALAQSAHLLTVSDDLRRIATARFGVDAAHATTIANGCNVNIFSLANRTTARQELGIPTDAKLILYVGRLVAAKGLRELLDAWIPLAEQDTQLHLAFVGEGGLGDELARAAKSSAMGERILMPGAALPARVATWMQACDVFCLPSHSEGYPNVLVEALACGRPVVATAVGGILEIVDASNGLLVPVGDVLKLRDALLVALTRPWDATALSKRFSRSWDNVARETLNVCESVAGCFAGRGVGRSQAQAR